MKLRLLVNALAVGFAMTAAAAIACPNEKTASAGEKKGGCDKPCGAKTVVTVADKVDDGRSAAADPVKKDEGGKPCHGATATTASDKAPCHGASATTASGKAPCGGGATATTASDKAPCGGAATAGKAPCSKPCHGEAKSASAEGDSDCPIGKKVKAVLASMPSMKYRVGEEVTPCSKTAAAMAEKAGKPMQYVVGDETFGEEAPATAKLASLLETELEAAQAVQFVAGGKCMRCPMTAKSVAEETKTTVTYRVGGVDFDKKEDAEKVAKLVSDAVAEVSMKYKVGDKTFCCDKMAGAAAKENGAKMTFVVGDQETCCPTTAKLRLTEAKLRKVVETAVATSLSL